MKTSIIIIGSSVLLALFVLNWPEPRTPIPTPEPRSQTSTPNLPVPRTFPDQYPGPDPDHKAALKEQAKSVEDYKKQLKSYIATMAEPFDNIKVQEQIALTATNEDARDRLLFEIESRKASLIKHFTEVQKDLYEADRKFLLSKGLSDNLISELQASEKMPWE